MSEHTPVIAVDGLVKRYGGSWFRWRQDAAGPVSRRDAVNGLSFTVQPGQCYGFFGRNGAGKTTTIKCLLNLLRPTAGRVVLFGMDPATHEVAVKSRLAWVPDQVAFYPWMTVRQAIDYVASFRTRWNPDVARSLVGDFRLDPGQKTTALSKGQKTQLALVCAIAAEPDLLILDEPTSGLDPIVRRDLIRTVIGAYQDADPGQRTIFVSTHLISEFEGLIDRFTIVDDGRDVLTLDADEARNRYRRIHARFAGEVPPLDLPGARVLRRQGRELELVASDGSADLIDRLRVHAPEALTSEALALEEIFVTALRGDRMVA